MKKKIIEENIKKYIIVGNPGSYYHEGFWQGKEKLFSPNKQKALLMFKNEAKEELKYVNENIICSCSFAMIITV